MKKILIFLLVLSLSVSLCTVGAAATETEPTNVPREPGFCGETLEWAFDPEEGVLTVTGEGDMDDFPEGAPWEEYRDEIVEVVLDEDVTYIGQNAFRDFDKLETVDFGKKLKEIGKEAFKSCDVLTKIHLPDTFKVFGESAFQSCSKLKEIHCDGVFPSFRLNCLWDTYAKIVFPADRPWGVTYIQQLEEAFNGRIEFMASDGTDPYVPTEPEESTEATTEATTEVTAEVTTEATEAVTEEATEQVTTGTTATEPSSESGTEPEPTEELTGEPTTEAAEPTEPENEEKERGLAGWIIPALIGAVIGFLVMGAVLSGGGKKRRKSGGKGGRYAD